MNETKDSRLVAYVSADLHEWVKDQASYQNRTVSNLVETVLTEVRREVETS